MDEKNHTWIVYQQKLLKWKLKHRLTQWRGEPQLLATFDPNSVASVGESEWCHWLNTFEWPHRQTCVCVSTRAPWISCPTWLDTCFARLPLFIAQHRRVEAGPTTKLTVSPHCGAKHSQLRQKCYVQSLKSTIAISQECHYRCGVGIYKLSTHITLDLTTCLI